MATEYNVRVSDADRDSIAAQLREHYAQGRLTLDELTQRLDHAFAARTRADLNAVTRDLPYAAATGMLPSDRPRHGGPGWGGSPQAGPGSQAGPGGSPAAFLSFIPLMVFLVVALLVLGVLGFGFGSGPSLWVIVLGALGAVRWLFGLGRRRGRGRGRGPRGRRPW